MIIVKAPFITHYLSSTKSEDKSFPRCINKEVYHQFMSLQRQSVGYWSRPIPAVPAGLYWSLANNHSDWTALYIHSLYRCSTYSLHTFITLNIIIGTYMLKCRCFVTIYLIIVLYIRCIPYVHLYIVLSLLYNL